MFEEAEVHVSLDGKVWVEISKGGASISVQPSKRRVSTTHTMDGALHFGRGSLSSTVVEVRYHKAEKEFDPLDMTEEQRARQKGLLYVKFRTKGQPWRTTGEGVLITPAQSGVFGRFVVKCGKVTEVAKE